MKQQKRKKFPWGIAIFAVVLAVAAVVFALRNSEFRDTKTSPSPTPMVGNSTHDEPTPNASTTTPTPANETGGKGSGVTVTKPTLQKSSGNAPGSSVPSGAIVEFTCEGTTGLGCELILTNRNNPSQVVNLGKKTIASNGRGQSMAIWDWNAVSGSWNVVAKSTDNAGNAASSDAQTLEVK